MEKKQRSIHLKQVLGDKNVMTDKSQKQKEKKQLKNSIVVADRRKLREDAAIRKF